MDIGGGRDGVQHLHLILSPFPCQSWATHNSTTYLGGTDMSSSIVAVAVWHGVRYVLGSVEGPVAGLL